MVELKVDLSDATTQNEDCFVSVRVGEFQKLARLSKSRTYRFPKASRHLGKIEVYKRVGACSVDCDPSSVRKKQVNVRCNDESIGSLQFTVEVCGDPSKREEPEPAKPPSQKAVMAKDYVTKHGLEANLSDAMQALLRERPENPTEFLAHKLLELSRHGSIMLPPASPKKHPEPVADVRQQVPAPGKEVNDLRRQAGDALVKVNDLRRQAGDALREAHSNGFLGQQLQQYRPRAFHLKQSVGTWLAKPPCVNKSPETKSFNYRPSVGTWLMPVGKEPEAPPPYLPVPKASTAPFVRKPSVGTWLAKPLIVSKAPELKSYNFRPSVGTWLVLHEPEEQPESPKAMVVSAMQLYGPTFPFSTGIRIL